MSNKQAAMVINKKDNVATAIAELKAGDSILVMGAEEKQLTLKSEIKFLHKLALENIKKGQYIIKYGQAIGEATRDINKGEHVHIHNLRSLRQRISG
jgi:altronate dehydratase small subunit